MEQATPGPAAKPYDLFDERSVVALLALFFAFLFYFLADNYIVLTFQPLEQMPALGYAGAALIGGGAALRLARKTPLTERVALCLMCAAVMLLAAQPLLPRVNAASSSQGAQAADYLQQRDGSWHADGLPDIRLDQRHANLAAGMTLTSKTLQFKLWRGALGFYQLDLSALRADYEAANSSFGNP